MNSNTNSNSNRRVTLTTKRRRKRTQKPPRRLVVPLAPGEKYLPPRPNSPPPLRNTRQPRPSPSNSPPRNIQSPPQTQGPTASENTVRQITNFIHNKAGTRRLASSTHPPACPLSYHVYKEREIILVRDRLFLNCHSSKTNGVGDRYIQDWVNQYHYPGSHALVFSAEDPTTRQVRAFVCLKLQGKSMTLDIVCGKEFGNPHRYCKNAMVNLMHFIELYALVTGVTRLYLSAIPSAVSFYARLGYVRQLDPCAPRNTMGGVPRADYLATFSHQLAHLNRMSATQLRNLAVLNQVYFQNKNGQLIFMSKCLKA